MLENEVFAHDGTNLEVKQQATFDIGWLKWSTTLRTKRLIDANMSTDLNWSSRASPVSCST